VRTFGRLLLVLGAATVLGGRAAAQPPRFSFTDGQPGWMDVETLLQNAGVARELKLGGQQEMQARRALLAALPWYTQEVQKVFRLPRDKQQARPNTSRICRLGNSRPEETKPGTSSRYLTRSDQLGPSGPAHSGPGSEARSGPSFKGTSGHQAGPVAQPAARFVGSDALNPGPNNPHPMTGTGSQPAQPLLPPDEPNTQAQTGQQSAPVQTPPRPPQIQGMI
jgi:hypothetical protein